MADNSKSRSNEVRKRASQGGALRYLNEVALTYEGEDCLPWPYARSEKGYGKIRIDGKTLRIPRLVCERVYGPPPAAEYESAHSCRNPPCVNKRHLRWATRQENADDLVGHGTANRGEKHNFAKLTENDVREIRRQLAGTEPRKVIAGRFNIHRTTLYKLSIGENWGWLK